MATSHKTNAHYVRSRKWQIKLFEIASVLGKVRANKTLCLRFGFSSTFSRVPRVNDTRKKYKKNYLIYLFLM